MQCDVLRSLPAIPGDSGDCLAGRSGQAIRAGDPGCDPGPVWPPCLAPVSGPRPVRIFFTSSRRPTGAARAADTAAARHYRRSSHAGRPQSRSADAKGLLPFGAATKNRQKITGGRGGFDKGTLAAALIGLSRAGRSQPDPPTSVRAAAPCQIRRSVSAGLTVWPASTGCTRARRYCQRIVDCSDWLLTVKCQTTRLLCYIATAGSVQCHLS